MGAERRLKWRWRIRNTLLAMGAGIILAYLIFLSMAAHLNIDNRLSVGICCLLAAVISGGLLYSPKMQCLLFLALPQLFNKRGRTMVVAFLFVITISGPVANTTRNTAVMLKSIACEQKIIGKIAKEIYTIIKKPLVAIKKAVEIILKQIKHVVEKLRDTMVRMYKAIVRIVQVIKKAFAFLARAANVCNRDVGTPFQRCVGLFQVARDDCRAKLGRTDALCDVTNLVEGICYSVKFIDYVCEFVEYVSDTTLERILQNVARFEREIHDMLYVSVKFKHHYHFDTNASKTFRQIRDDIVEDVRDRSKMFWWLLSWIDCVSGAMFLAIVLRVAYYKSKYMTSDRFDNLYINQQFIEIDRTRTQLGRDSVLPLKRKEALKYVFITSMRLTKPERLRVIRSASFMFTSTWHIISMICIDYSLHWLLATVRYYGLKQAGIETPPAFSYHVIGEGLIAELIHGIVAAFSPLVNKFHIDPKPCLPQPSPPDYLRYAEITALLALAWAMLLFEPYGLRMRQVTMNRYHPDRSRERAAWLYQQILRKRMSFVKFARRELRRRFTKDGGGIERVACMELVRAKLNHLWIFRKLFSSGRETFCMLCGCSIRKSEDILKCVQPGCVAIYCTTCHRDLQRTCSICMQPVDYGDLSDISEEADSCGDDVADVPSGYVFIDSETGDRCGFQVLPAESDRYRRCKYF